MLNKRFRLKVFLQDLTTKTKLHFNLRASKLVLPNIELIGVIYLIDIIDHI